MENKEKVINFIKKQEIPEEDKAEWQVVVENSPKEYADSLTEMVDNFPEEFGWFNDIYKRKKAAFGLWESDKSAAGQMLSEIYAEEKQRMEELYNKMSV